jgi:hypothetical protein
MDALVGYSALELLTVENANLPLDLLPRFPQLKGLITGSITLPQETVSEPCYKKLGTMMTIRIIQPLNWGTTQTFLRKSVKCLKAFGINTSVTETKIQKACEKAPNLHWLTLLSPSAVKLSWLLPLKKALRRLTVSAQLTIDITNVSPENSNIEHVTLKNCQGVADFNFLTRFKKLTNLVLRETPLLTTVNQLTVILTKKQEALTKLDLSGAAILDDGFLDKLRETELRLEHLIARRSKDGANAGFTDVGLNNYLRWPLNSNLTTLDIAGHAQITEYPFVVGGTEDAIACIPNLTNLCLRYTKIGTCLSDHLIVWRDSVLKPSINALSQQVPTTTLSDLNLHMSGISSELFPIKSSVYPNDNIINMWFYGEDRRGPYPGPDAIKSDKS